MKRTLIDQHFSRRIIALSKIVIHTGEDNYLTTADAIENGHQVLASQFINERFALNAKMGQELMGLGHAQEMNPEHPNVFLLEIARAQMTRDIFPKSPIKFMPPTRHKCGDIFYSHLMDAMFNFVGVLTGPDDPASRHGDRGDAHAAASRPLDEHQERQVHFQRRQGPRQRHRVQARRDDRELGRESLGRHAGASRDDRRQRASSRRSRSGRSPR